VKNGKSRKIPRKRKYPRKSKTRENTPRKYPKKRNKSPWREFREGYFWPVGVARPFGA
jgi:hypothetical protein